MSNNNKEFYEFMETIENLSKTKPPIYISDKMIEEFEPKKLNKNQNNFVTSSIKKSVNNTKISKKNLNAKTKKIEKGIIILLITTIATTSLIATPKIITYAQTEHIKTECIEKFYTETKELGLDINKLTAEGIINLSSPEYLNEKLFEIFLLINDTYKMSEAPKLYDLLVQKAGLANTFDEYLMNEGYVKEVNGKNYPSITVWENTMESQKLAEKQAKGRGV